MAIGQRVEVFGDRPAVLGGDRLGVELDAPHRPGAVLDPHHHAVLRPGDLVPLRAHRAGDRQRVVANDREVLRDAGEEAGLVVADAAEAPVHRHRRGADAAVEQVADPLVAEADAEHRDLAVAEDVPADAEVVPAFGPARAGREHDRVEVGAREDPPGDGVVVDHDRLLARGRRQQVEDVVRVGVVVVDQQRPHRAASSPRPRTPSSSTVRTTRSTSGERSPARYQRAKWER